MSDKTQQRLDSEAQVEENCQTGEMNLLASKAILLVSVQENSVLARYTLQIQILIDINFKY